MILEHILHDSKVASRFQLTGIKSIESQHERSWAKLAPPAAHGAMVDVPPVSPGRSVQGSAWQLLSYSSAYWGRTIEVENKNSIPIANMNLIAVRCIAFCVGVQSKHTQRSCRCA